MIKGVIFDLDGVIADTELYYAACRRSFLASYGVELSEEESRKMAGFHFLSSLEQLQDRISPELYLQMRREFVPFPVHYPDLIRPEVPDIMRALKTAGKKVAIASNTTGEKIQRLIHTCNLEGYVDAAVSGAAIGRTKPEPDVYLKAGRMLGLSCRECVAVEDSDPGLLAARRAGCTVVCLVDRRFGFRQDVADLWIDCLGQLLEAVAQIEKGLPTLFGPIIR